jgi:uncharacterized protein YdeI (YjbR/CyaY-like superfamily)
MAGAKKKATKAAPRSTRAIASELPIMTFESTGAWAAWLRKHHASSAGIWLRLAKKASGVRSVTYAEAVEAALCWGFIDGQKRAYDAGSWLQKFGPRGARSIWSKINREKAIALIASGAMQPPGLAAVEIAKQNGHWSSAYDGQRSSVVPDDLVAALATNPRAAKFFAGLDSANRYAVLFRLQTAKRAETRVKRLAQFVAMLAKHEKIHP